MSRRSSKIGSEYLSFRASVKSWSGISTLLTESSTSTPCQVRKGRSNFFAGPNCRMYPELSEADNFRFCCYGFCDICFTFRQMDRRSAAGIQRW
ncbi:hypothetical protein CHARACLAT_001664 [Characodon lateralis]|uniref:Uncharacterized protein n=1 Tax=Characodon lateralis TaxID=208331 RepID=A0ABU7EZT2_9TELE|nr:hypothetical protein [Characodon lateralis]